MFDTSAMTSRHSFVEEYYSADIIMDYTESSVVSLLFIKGQFEAVNVSREAYQSYLQNEYSDVQKIQQMISGNKKISSGNKKISSGNKKISDNEKISSDSPVEYVTIYVAYAHRDEILMQISEREYMNLVDHAKKSKTIVDFSQERIGHGEEITPHIFDFKRTRHHFSRFTRFILLILIGIFILFMGSYALKRVKKTDKKRGRKFEILKVVQVVDDQDTFHPKSKDITVNVIEINYPRQFTNVLVFLFTLVGSGLG